jgi:hypothetical protein
VQVVKSQLQPNMQLEKQQLQLIANIITKQIQRSMSRLRIKLLLSRLRISNIYTPMYKQACGCGLSV